MTGLLRQLLGWVASLGTTAILLFATMMVVRDGHADLPWLLNPGPESSSRLAASVLARFERGDSDTAKDVERLGAILAIYAMPKLAGLDLKAQARLLQELRPVRLRMGDGSVGLGTHEAEPGALDRDLAFWRRFTEERTLDFRAPARARIVERWLSGELAIRRTELVALDTYALPELVARLGRMATEDDVRRARLLVPAITRLTNHSWFIPKTATPEEAARVVASIRRFWDRSSAAFNDYTPLEMVAEALRQTELSVLLAELGRGLWDDEPNEELRWALLDLRGLTPAMSASALGAFLLGPLLAALLGLARVARPNQARSFFELPLLAGATLSLTAVPFESPLAGLGVLAGALFTGTTVAYLLTTGLNDRLDFALLRVLERRKPRRRIIALLEGFAPAVPTLLPILFFEMFVVALLCPWSPSRPPVVRQVMTHLAQGELQYPMTIAVSLAGLTAAFERLAEPLRGVLGRGLEELS